jgi:hypothetical protein
MARKILGVAAGLAIWFVIAALAGIILRATWPAYVQVAEAMTFTLPMLIARLGIGAFATIATGFVAARIAQAPIAAWVPGILLLAAFIPQHVMLWNRFPLWYHLTFLVSLVPLTYAGYRMACAAADKDAVARHV